MSRVPGVNASPYSVVRADSNLLGAAASRLVAKAAGGRDAGQEFLDAASRHRIDLTNMFVSLGRGGDKDVRQVSLAVPGAGRTAMFFTTTPACEGEIAELAEVVGACGGAAAGRLGQALLEPKETTIASALGRAGFKRLAELAYLRATLPSHAAAMRGPAPGEIQGLPEGVTATTMRKGEDADLLAALDRSYIETLDCPELCDLRSTSDTLESHRATGGEGAHDPNFWWIIRDQGKPEGAMLFNPCRDQGHIELVYLGLSPALRGRGIAKALLSYGLAALARRPHPERLVSCAVDQRNAPAKRLYSAAGFREFATRVALVKRLP